MTLYELAVSGRIADVINKIGATETHKIINESIDVFSEKLLVSYAKAYKENPKAFIGSFLKYDSIKMAACFINGYANKKGLLKELEGQKDFTEWVSKQPLEARWKPVMEKFLLVLWAVTK